MRRESGVEPDDVAGVALGQARALVVVEHVIGRGDDRGEVADGVRVEA